MTTTKDFFCHLPFVSVLTDGKNARPCCKFQSKSTIPLKDYEKNPEIIEVKKLLFDGMAPAQCQRCVIEEKQTGKSFRTLANDFHPDLSAEVRQHDDQYFAMRFVDVIGSNVCNLQCLPCEHGSFKRSQELHTLGLTSVVPILRKINDIEIIADLPIQDLTLCSGEPFYDKQCWQLLELLVQKSKSQQIRLNINTNLTGVTVERLDWLDNNFSEVLIKGSIDGLGMANDYLRYPCAWSEISESVDMILARPQIRFVITTALSNLSLITYAALVEHFLSKGVVDFFISQVTTPEVLNAGNLPDRLKEQLQHELRSVTDRHQLTDRTLDAINLCYNICHIENTRQPTDLTDFLDRHDRARHTNWRATWPELAEFC